MLSEWLKEHDWKSCIRALTCIEGSNPSHSVSLKANQVFCKKDLPIINNFDILIFVLEGSGPLVKWLRHRPFTAVT